MAGFISDLYRTQLCRYGLPCSDDGRTYVHRRSELRALYEVEDDRSYAWATYRVDRWFGQVLSDSQLQTLFACLSGTPISEIPIWALGMQWFYRYMPSSYASCCGWDFNLSADISSHQRYRRDPDISFEPRLWQSLETRKIKLRDTVSTTYHKSE